MPVSICLLTWLQKDLHMAEQSSSVTSFRAFVMLTCVLLIPLAAVGGNSFPSVVKAIKEGRMPTLADFRGPTENTKPGMSEAPRFVASNAPSTATPLQQGGSAQNYSRANTASPTVVPLNYEVPVGGLQGQSTTFPQNTNAENRDFPAVRAGGTSQLPSTSATLPLRQNNAIPNGSGANYSLSAGGTSQQHANAISDPDATITAIHERLKQLGATYYVLEPYGERMESFRCFCKVAIGGNPHFTRNFQQIDADPIRAMSTVLQQIEDWRKHG
jgi:hypothetical protein